MTGDCMKRLLILPLLFAAASCASPESNEAKSFYQPVDSNIQWVSLKEPEPVIERATITSSATNLQDKAALFLIEISVTDAEKAILGPHVYNPSKWKIYKALDKICHEADTAENLKAGWTYSYILVPSEQPTKMLSKVVYDERTCSTVAMSG